MTDTPSKHPRDRRAGGNMVVGVVSDREPTLEEVRQLGAEDGYEIAEALISHLREGATPEQLAGMVETARRQTSATVDKLRAAGRREAFVQAYVMGCYEAMDHAMALYARGQKPP